MCVCLGVCLGLRLTSIWNERIDSAEAGSKTSSERRKLIRLIGYDTARSNYVAGISQDVQAEEGGIEATNWWTTTLTDSNSNFKVLLTDKSTYLL